jgi:hypothetical protein
VWLQSQRDTCDLRFNSVYRKNFNRFYRVRRGRDWQDKFYELLEARKAQAVRFTEVLESLHHATGRIEASFASKLLATVDPNMPVIDSIVLRNLDLRLPSYGSNDRISRIAELHSTLVMSFREFLMTETGRYLVECYRHEYADVTITEVKMLDFVLWQTRPARPPKRGALKVQT